MPFFKFWRHFGLKTKQSLRGSISELSVILWPCFFCSCLRQEWIHTFSFCKNEHISVIFLNSLCMTDSYRIQMRNKLQYSIMSFLYKESLDCCILNNLKNVTNVVASTLHTASNEKYQERRGMVKFTTERIGDVGLGLVLF